MSETLRIAHVTDPHLICLDGLRASQLLGKRLIGWLNIVLNRVKIHKPDLAFRVLEEVRSHKPDHVVVTGDLGNLALPAEYQLLNRWLGSLDMDAEQITVVPGNHDAYVESAVRAGHMFKILGPYMTSSPEYRTEPHPPGPVFPLVRVAGRLFIVGCSSAVPSPPFMAWGKLGRVQLSKLESLLRAGGQMGAFRIVAVHHPVQPAVTRLDNGLVDDRPFRQVLARVGAELVLHGHMHRPMRALLAGPRSTPIQVLGTGSASLDSPRTVVRAQFRLIDIGDAGIIQDRLYVHDPGSTGFVQLNEDTGSVRR